ncbi:MAG: thrC, partial [Modestobacter sp.]|nr:thrC [Modestobacter sp.]
MTLTAPGSAQADVTAGGPIPPSPARGLVCRNCGATFGLIAEHA